MKNEVYYNDLYAVYAPLLTERQKDVFDLYYGCDLSLGEIAEMKNISRQGVAACLSACEKLLVEYEEKLGFLAKRGEILRAIGNAGDLDSLKISLKKILGDADGDI